MRVSLRWLQELVDVPTEKANELEGVFASLGMEPDTVEHLDRPFEGVVVARVDEIEPHPNADRLRVCRVTSPDGTSEVVCGAWNFAAGALVPLAPPGAVLAEGVEVGSRAIRGVTSEGMICSAKELDLGEDAEGILVLEGGFQLGADFVDLLPFPDVVFDLEIVTNRPDEMSMLGVARELAAYYGLETREPDVVLEPNGELSEAEILIDDPVGCLRFVAIPMSEVTVGPAPLWMQLRLRAAGVRPINNVVDVTNYVMLETGQPLHAFDLDRVTGQKLVVRRASRGERLVTLDGIDRELSAKDLVIVDAAGPTSMAGVMGGEGSEVSSQTTRVLVEAANWDPATIWEMSLRHTLRTEASARFERGVDPNLPPIAARRAAQLISDGSGGKASDGMFDYYPNPIEPWEVFLPAGEVTRLLGAEIKASRVTEILERLGMEVQGDDSMTVRVPTRRRDVTRPADLVEEVARLYGYNELPETLPLGGGGGLTFVQRRTRRLRQVLVGAGFAEAQTFSFMSATDLDRLGIPEGDPRGQTIAMNNPVSEEDGLLRTSLVPGLLRAVAYNVARGIDDVALFEIGRVYLDAPSSDDERIPSQPKHVAFVAVGETGPNGLQMEPSPVDVYTATGTWSLLVSALGLDAVEVHSERIPELHPARGASLRAGADVIGTLGELHPAVARSYQLAGRVAVGEILLDPLVGQKDWWALAEPSAFPPVRFDLSFEVDRAVPAKQLIDQITEAGGEYLEAAWVFDEFAGGALPRDRKSLAVRVELRAPDRTLTEEEVRPIQRRMVAAVEAQLGASLRGEV